MECLQRCIQCDCTKGPLRKQQILDRQECNDELLSYSVQMDLGRTCTVRCAYLSQNGYYPDDPEHDNQDAFQVISDLDGDDGVLMAGVFDGHGEYGDDCSGFVRERIENSLCKHRRQHRLDPDFALRQTFQEINAAMHLERNFSDKYSGTTGVVALLDRGTCWVANAGDSRAIIGQEVGGALRAKALTTDHTPFSKEERQRIRDCGGEIMTHGQKMGDQSPPESDSEWDLSFDNEANLEGVVPRVWAPNKETPGCAFTRSLGDSLGESFGVIGKPEISRKDLRPHDRFLCLCSDGVWEFLTNQRVCDIIAEVAYQLDPDGHTLSTDVAADAALAACRAVVAESYQMWLEYDVRTDDITMVLLLLDFGKASFPSRSGGGEDQVPESARARAVSRPVRRRMSAAKLEELGLTSLPPNAVAADSAEVFALEVGGAGAGARGRGRKSSLVILREDGGEESGLTEGLSHDHVAGASASSGKISRDLMDSAAATKLGGHERKTLRPELHGGWGGSSEPGAPSSAQAAAAAAGPSHHEQAGAAAGWYRRPWRPTGLSFSRRRRSGDRSGSPSRRWWQRAANPSI